MSEIFNLNIEGLLDIVSNESRVVALVWIRSCCACAKFKPVFNQLPEYFDTVTFLWMNQLKTIENLRYSESKGMDETPTIFIYCNGELVESIIGYHSIDETVGILEGIFEKSNC